MANANPTTGVRYGYISANSLDSEILDELQYGMQAVDAHFEELQTEIEEALSSVLSKYLYDKWEIEDVIDLAIEHVGNNWHEDEPVHEGEYEGVRYRTSWLGGALNVWIFDSPVTGHYAECSPCVPGAGNLDCPDLDGVVCYDVPKEWRNARS